MRVFISERISLDGKQFGAGYRLTARRYWPAAARWSISAFGFGAEDSKTQHGLSSNDVRSIIIKLKGGES